MASGTLAVETLGSDNKIALLNVIDKLRSVGVSELVSLPQLIVCGDQSSGKSSVLEAISGIPFPRKDSLCTRFATEVILRHDAKQAVSVAIVPSTDRTDDQKAKLASFKRTMENLEDISSIVEDAKSCMGVDQNSTAFSKDILRIEISGPKQPHLTIVDLPGLIHFGNKNQSDSDVKLVQSMVAEYMKNSRSIILAVVSAMNDYANQVVLKRAREVDPDGRRTLGVITKPDMLPVGSDTEAAFLSLAKNQDIPLRLGWHVLRNRGFEDRELTTQGRDEAEKTFFNTGKWMTLDKNVVGIQSLQEKMSKVLFDQIRNELPTLIEDLEEKTDTCRRTLEKLGPSRDGLVNQQTFLVQISEKFQAIARAATDGSYENAFFGYGNSAEAYSKRIRAVVQDLNVQFAEKMHTQGQQVRISDSPAKITNPSTMSRAEYLDHVKELLKTSRGRELPGMYNPLIVGELFREQSKPWARFARVHLKEVWQAVKTFLSLLVLDLTNGATSEALTTQVIAPLMEEKLRLMEEKLKELLQPYHNMHPVTYNHYFTETIQKMKLERQKAELERRLATSMDSDDVDSTLMTGKSVLAALTSTNEADMVTYACTEILDCLEAYYKVIPSPLLSVLI